MRLRETFKRPRFGDARILGLRFILDRNSFASSFGGTVSGDCSYGQRESPVYLPATSMRSDMAAGSSAVELLG